MNTKTCICPNVPKSWSECKSISDMQKMASAGTFCACNNYDGTFDWLDKKAIDRMTIHIAKGLNKEVAVYCPVSNVIGVLDYSFQDTSLTGFYVGKTFRVTSFPIILGSI